MGTRGLYGLYKDSVSKLTYNHFDSYPSYLGVCVIDFILETSIDEMREIFDRMIMVTNSEQPTLEIIDECLKYYDTQVSTGSPTEWYALLRNSQGDLMAWKDGLRYMIDSYRFIKDSLFCEWAYVINLDDKCLEVYVGGLSKKPQSKSVNRYEVEEPDEDGRYASRLLYIIPFDILRMRCGNDESYKAELIEAMEKEEHIPGCVVA